MDVFDKIDRQLNIEKGYEPKFTRRELILNNGDKAVIHIPGKDEKYIGVAQHHHIKGEDGRYLQLNLPIGEEDPYEGLPGMSKRTTALATWAYVYAIVKANGEKHALGSWMVIETMTGYRDSVLNSLRAVFDVGGDSPTALIVREDKNGKQGYRYEPYQNAIPQSLLDAETAFAETQTAEEYLLEKGRIGIQMYERQKQQGVFEAPANNDDLNDLASLI